MATTLARMEQLISTTADYAANDLVLLNGEIGFELLVSGDITGKVGDGVTTYSLLPYTIGVGVNVSTDQTIGGVKRFTDTILVENQSDDTKYAQIYADVFPALVHALFLDSREINSNVYIQARDDLGAAQTLALGADGKLYWKSKVIADENGIYGRTWGRFDGAGLITGGAGFSVAKQATGHYSLTFDVAAETTQEHTLVAMIGTIANSSVSCTGYIYSTTEADIFTTEAGDVAVDAAVSFLRNYETAGTFS